MIGILLRAAGLAAIYLLVLTSIHPGDVAIGCALGLGLALLLRPRHDGREAEPARMSPLGVAATLARTGLEMVVGSWRVVRFCLGATASPGFVEIPREDRSRVEVALWGVLTGEAPDEVVVDVDEERDVLIVHLVDASDAGAVRARHHETHKTLRGRKEP